MSGALAPTPPWPLSRVLPLVAAAMAHPAPSDTAHALRDMGAALPPFSAIMAAVAVCVADKYDVTVADLKGDDTARHFSIPRQEAMALCHMAGRSNFQVAVFFNRTCHTTVIHARKKYADRAELMVAA